jgi:hypothetical protein
MGSAAKPLGTAIATITPGWSANRKRSRNGLRGDQSDVLEADFGTTSESALT